MSAGVPAWSGLYRGGALMGQACFEISFRHRARFGLFSLVRSQVLGEDYSNMNWASVFLLKSASVWMRILP